MRCARGCSIYTGEENHTITTESLPRYMVMNVKMDGRTWEQLLFILLQITQLTLTESPPRF